MSQQQRIKTLFLQPVESYALQEAAHIVGVSPATLRREAKADAREAYMVGGRWRFTWRQLAFIAMQRWTLAEIHAALGEDAVTVLPPLLALRTVTVRLPEYILRALETIAANGQTTLDDCLYAELIDFAGTVPAGVKRQIPGYRHAYLFPGRE